MDRNSDSDRDQRASKAMLIAMVIVVAAIVAVSIYANWQNAHRDRIESTIVTRFTPTPTPPRSPMP
ncbi:MAG: hypothetical protein DME86_09635 [Verrucomicrobia bacterium]|nr:MAG: hypothetical protein DME86_09635 [Verrucomicrobiota bacterium]